MDTIVEANTQLAKLDNTKDVRFLDIGKSFIDADGNTMSSLEEMMRE